jgi:hypothetical protein
MLKLTFSLQQNRRYKGSNLSNYVEKEVILLSILKIKLYIIQPQFILHKNHVIMSHTS